MRYRSAEDTYHLHIHITAGVRPETVVRTTALGAWAAELAKVRG